MSIVSIVSIVGIWMGKVLLKVHNTLIFYYQNDAMEFENLKTKLEPLHFRLKKIPPISPLVLSHNEMKEKRHSILKYDMEQS